MRRAAERHAGGAHLGHAGAALALDDAPDRHRLEAVAGAHEARQRRLHQHRQPHRDLAGAEAEALGAARHLRADLEVGEVVRQLDGDLGDAGRTDRDRGIEIGHRLEVEAHGDAIEEAPGLLLAHLAAGILGEGQEAEGQVAAVAQGQPRGDRGDEIGQRIEPLLAAQRQHRLVHQPQRHLAADRPPLRVGERDRDLDLLARPPLGGVAELDLDAVVERLHLEPGGGGDGGGLAEVGVAARLRRRARHPPALEHEVHRQARRIVAVDRQLEGGGAAFDRQPLIGVAFRRLDHRQRPAALEGALEHQHRGLARPVLGLVGDDVEGARRRLGPGHGLLAPGVEIDRHDLRAAQPVARLDLDDVDAGARDGQGHRLRAGAARQLDLGDLLVHDVGAIARHAVGEVGGLQVRMPLALQQAHGDRLPGERLVVGADHHHLGLDAGGPLDVARHLEAEHEGRQRDDGAGGGHRLVVGAGDRRLDHVGARLRRRLDGRVEHQLGGAGRVGRVLALEARRRLEAVGAREAPVRGVEESREAAGRPAVGELGDPPGQRPGGDAAAGIVLGGQADRELAVERHHVGGVQLHLELRQPVGLHAERHLAELGAAVGGFESRRVDAGRQLGLLELVIEGARRGDGDRQAPDQVARAVDHHHAGIGDRRQVAAVAPPQVALDVHRLLGAVDRPFGEDVAEGLGLRGAEVEALQRPAQPVLAAGPPLAVAIGVRRVAGIEHQDVLAQLGDDPLHRRGPRAVARGLPGDAARGVGRALEQRLPARAVAAVHRAFDADAGPGDRRGGRQRGHDEDHRQRPFDRRQRQVGDLQPHVEAALGVEAPEADQVGAGGVAAGEALQVGREVEAEAGGGAGPAQRQRHQLRHRRRAQRPQVVGEGGGVDPLVGSQPGLELLAGAGRAGRFVERDRRVRERPERAVQRIDGIDAQIDALEAAALERQLPRAEALDDPLAGGPAQEAGELREGEEDLALAVHLERPPLGVGDAGGGRQPDAVQGVAAEVAAGDELPAGDLERQPRHRRLEAHQVAGRDRRQLAGKGGRELDAHLPCLVLATQRLLAAVTRARGGDRRRRPGAAQGGDAETLGGLEAQVQRGLGGLLGERQAEVQHGARAQRHRPRQGDDVGRGSSWALI